MAKKKEKIIYIDDGRTIADMSGITAGPRMASSPSRSTAKEKLSKFPGGIRVSTPRERAYFIAATLNAFHAEGALFDRKCRVAFLDRADGEVTVAALDGFFVAGIDRQSERDVGTLRMSLQADAERKRSALFLRQEQVIVREISFFGLQSEVNVPVSVQFAVFRDFKDRFAFGKFVHSEQIAQGLFAGVLPCRKVGNAVVPHGRTDAAAQGDNFRTGAR